MKRTHHLLAAAVLAAPLTAAPVRAQTETQPREAQVTQHGKHSGLITISFPGGTMGEFVDALKAGIDGPLNVLLRRQAADLEVPPMDLRMVSLRSAFELAVPERGSWTEIQPDGSRIDYFRDLEQIGGQDHASAPVFVIDAHQRHYEPQPLGGRGQEPKPRIEVFSVERTVEGESDVRKLLTAIDTALALGEGDRDAEVKYHPDSALLIVRGTPDQVHTIERVIERFRDSSATRQNERFERASRLADLKAELIERRADLQRTTAEMELGLQELNELKQLEEKEMVSQREVREAETRLRMTEAEMQAARARLQATEERMAMLASSIERPEMEDHELRLQGGPVPLRRAVKMMKAIDQISGHIQSVEANDIASDRVSTGGRITVRIRADEEGARVLRMLAESSLAGVTLDESD